MRSKFYLKIFLLIFFACGVLYSCQKDDNSASQLNVSVSADSTSIALGAANVSFTSGSLVVNNFKFDAKVEGTATETVSTGPYSLDLYDPNPNIIVIPVNRGFYSNVQIKVNIIKSSTTAPLILMGKYTNAMGTTIPVELDFNENTSAILKIKDQLVTDQFTGYTIYMRLYLTRLFAGIKSSDLDRAMLTNNTILITNTLNRPIYSKVKTNIINSMGGDVSEVDVNDN